MLRKYASLEILESWREPARGSGLVKSAHRVAFDYEPRPGFLYVRSRMISSRCNDNHDEFPAPEIEAGYRTFLGKPVFVNHHNSNHRRARGVIVAIALHRDRNPDGTPDTWVEGLMEIDALRFPRLARAIIKRRINRTSMGVDVEESTCSACGNKATSPADYCRHLPALKGKKIRLRRDGKIREEIIREICAGLSFFENSLLVEEPADPTAIFLGDIDTRGLNVPPRRASLDVTDQRSRDGEQEGGENYVIPSSQLPRVNIPSWEHKASLRAEAAPAPPGQHPFFQHSPVSSEHVVDAYNEADDNTRAIGRHWYPQANDIAGAMAHKHGHPLETAAGVISAYSPRTLWPVNLMNASRAMADPDNPPGPGTGAMGNHQKAAHRILHGEHYNDVLQASKTNAFAHLIHHGGDTPEDVANGKHRVVVDRHALSVAVGHRVSDAENNKAPLDQPQHYEHIADTYRQAASELSQQYGHDIHPHEVQAVTWMVQQNRNHKIDQEAGKGADKGRISLEVNSWKRWHQHAHEQHPEVQHEHFHLVHPGKSMDEMHEPLPEKKPAGKKTAGGFLHLAYGETAVPPKINTLRQEECPVCGEANVWTGQRCPVCGFVAPPDLFRDPDTDKAAQVRQELEQAGQVAPGGMPQGPADEFGQQGSFPDSDQQLFHPDQITPNGVPGPAFGAPAGDMEPGPDEENPEEAGQGTGEEELEEGQQEEQAGEEEQEEGEQELEASVLGCPSCGTVFQPGDQGAQEGSRCPACGQAPLVPVDGDDSAEKDQEPSPEGEEVMSTKTATQREQIAGLRRENAVLRAQLRFVAELAGVGPQMDEIRRQADLMNPASPVPDPPQQPATQSTEEALASGGTEHSGPWPRGTGHTEDDPSRPGTTPGSTTNVPAAQTTTAITPGVEMQTPPATNLTDVTAPVTGTNPAQDGGVPMEQRRIETDVRVDPDPLKASGPGIGGQGNDGSAFPWMIGARQAASPALEKNGAIRTMASMRLGRLRVQAGLASGDDLEVGAGIERDASLSIHDIEREIEVISEMERRRPAPMQRTAQRRQAARSAPSMASAPAPLAYATAASMDEADAFDIFLD